MIQTWLKRAEGTKEQVQAKKRNKYKTRTDTRTTPHNQTRGQAGGFKVHAWPVILHGLRSGKPPLSVGKSSFLASINGPFSIAVLNNQRGTTPFLCGFCLLSGSPLKALGRVCIVYRSDCHRTGHGCSHQMFDRFGSKYEVYKLPSGYLT